MDDDDHMRYTQISVDIASTAPGQSVIRGAEALNAKASALLTHVSIMVAIATGFLVTFGRTREGAYDIIVLTEIIGYLLIGVLCLSAIWASDGSTFKTAHGDPLTRLVAVTSARRRRYQLALKATIFLTLALIVNIIFYASGGHILLLNTTVIDFVSEFNVMKSAAG